MQGHVNIFIKSYLNLIITYSFITGNGIYYLCTDNIFNIPKIINRIDIRLDL